MTKPSLIRTYEPAESAVFFRTRERFGGFSNMAGGFPLVVNGVSIRTSEALYQACKFPHRPDVQRRIVTERSPMAAKKHGRSPASAPRPDWERIRVKVMRWCLRVKLAQNLEGFGSLLISTGDSPIVEKSYRDDYWGAKVAEDGMLVGGNVLGRLLMELREQMRDRGSATMGVVDLLPVPDFLLYEQPIATVRGEATLID